MSVLITSGIISYHYRHYLPPPSIPSIPSIPSFPSFLGSALFIKSLFGLGIDLLNSNVVTNIVFLPTCLPAYLPSSLTCFKPYL